MLNKLITTYLYVDLHIIMYAVLCAGILSYSIRLFSAITGYLLT